MTERKEMTKEERTHIREVAKQGGAVQLASMTVLRLLDLLDAVERDFQAWRTEMGAQIGRDTIETNQQIAQLTERAERAERELDAARATCLRITDEIVRNAPHPGSPIVQSKET